MIRKKKPENHLKKKYGKMVPVDQMKKSSLKEKEPDQSEKTTAAENVRVEKAPDYSFFRKSRKQENALTVKYGKMVPADQLKKKAAKNPSSSDGGNDIKQTTEKNGLPKSIDLSPVLDVEELEKMIPDIVAEQNEPEQTAPEGDASEQNVPEQTAPEGDASEQNMPEQTAPEGDASEQNVPEQTAPEGDSLQQKAQSSQTEKKIDKQQTSEFPAFDLQQKLEALADIEIDHDPDKEKISRTAELKTNIISAKASEIPAEAGEIPAEASEIPAEAGEIPTGTAEIPAEAGEITAEIKDQAEEIAQASDAVPERIRVPEVQKPWEKSEAPEETGTPANPEEVKTSAKPEAPEETGTPANPEEVKTPEKPEAPEQNKVPETFFSVAKKIKFCFREHRMYFIIGALALMVTYLGISAYYKMHFFPNTLLNGVDVSGESREEAVDSFERLMSDDYSLTIVERGGITETISSKDINMTVESESAIRQLLKEQEDIAWPANILKMHILKADMEIIYDNKLLKKAADGLNCMKSENQIMPEDAYISDYSEEKGFTIVPESEGTAIDKNKLVSGIESALQSLQTQVSLEEAGAYKEASVTSNDPALAAAVEQMNQYCRADIILEVGEAVNEINGCVISGWLSYDENGNVTLSDEGISSYVGNLCTKYDTAWDDETLTTSYGDTITIGNCHYGWLIDREVEKQQIREEIETGKTVTRDLNWSMTANSHGPHDYGDSYVEINLTRQHLFLYYEGKCVIDTPIVSGNTSKGNGTHTGVFGIMYCEKDATLVGENYSSPVKYWMPFNGNEGMHDASWRDKFGGSLYQYAGSHGCVNLPTDAAATIFSYVSANYPVLVYYEE